MKKINLRFFIIVISSISLFSQKKIEPVFAKNHVGDAVIVTGTVDQVYKSRTGTFFLNMGKPPFYDFTAVLFASDTNKFGDLNSFSGEIVEISGVIQLYKGTPQIILRNDNQLKFISGPPKLEKPIPSYTQ